jgi:hypothetical protein
VKRERSTPNINQIEFHLNAGHVEIPVSYQSGSQQPESYQVAIRKLLDNRKRTVDLPRAIGYVLDIE